MTALLAIRNSHSQLTYHALENDMKVLMVLTSHDQLGNTGRKTGFWLEELAAPYYTVQGRRRRDRAGLAAGRPAAARSEKQRAGQSDRPDTPLRKRRGGQSATRGNRAPRQRLRRRTSTRCSIPAATARCGTSPKTAHSIALIQSFIAAGKPVALVCHAPGVPAPRHHGGRQAAGRRQDR